jgi:hypothetical protein
MSVDISSLLLTATSYPILLISLHMLLKLASVCSIISMMNTTKIEPRTSLFQAATLPHNCEALR